MSRPDPVQVAMQRIAHHTVALKEVNARRNIAIQSAIRAGADLENVAIATGLTISQIAAINANTEADKLRLGRTTNRHTRTVT